MATAIVAVMTALATTLSGCAGNSSSSDDGADAIDVIGDTLNDTGSDTTGDTWADIVGDTADPGPFEWPVATEDVYITPSDDWKNQVVFPDDPFLGGTGMVGYSTYVPRWIKFAVLMKDPDEVYFQDSQKYAFHYEFATERLDPFKGMSSEQFDAISLHADGQEAILGAVLYAPGGDPAEVGVQLVRMDPYHPEMVRRVFETVTAAVTHGPVAGTSAAAASAPRTVADPLKFFYFPTFEQYASAVQYRDWFAAHGIAVSSVDRWAGGDQCYSPGWTIGRLVEIAGNDIDRAYVAGELLPTDILLTDAVPAEVPFVAGIITGRASTPNSHVAILATSLDVPFVWISDDERLQQVKSLVGRRVALWTRTDWSSATTCAVTVMDASGLVDADVDELLATKTPGPLDFPARTHRGAFWASTDDIGPADAKFFGGKASNYGILRDAIPDNAPPAIALSFDLWESFMAQPFNGGTLGLAISNRLAAHKSWPPDMKTLDSDLTAVREMIGNADFPADLQAAIRTALAGFDPDRKIRFRSSTNMEDAAEFTGAGLYDSYSGCLADDDDADESGPSMCDPAEPKERGVFRAIKKVYASFYNRNAFLERLRRQVDESKTGMAILTHYSYPDADELANGVVTFNVAEYSTTGTMVSQLGAVSVANPENGALPEIVSLYSYGSGELYPEVTQESSLVPIGGRVMDWDADYRAFFELFNKVATRWASETGRNYRWLDIEYKKMKPDDLIIKQVREVPHGNAAGEVAAFLIGGSDEWCTFQGESSDIYGVHRLKARISLAARSGFADDLSASGWLDTIRLEYRLDGITKVIDGPVSSLQNLTWTRDSYLLSMNFTTGTGDDQIEWGFGINLPIAREAQNGPLMSLDDVSVWANLSARFARTSPWLDWEGNVSQRDTENTSLIACDDSLPVGSGHTLVERDFTDTRGNTYNISFWWPPEPTGIVAGYTAPLVQWGDTVITGFTTLPISLSGWWSRTQRPGHHNFSEDYAFEPRLEEGLDAGTLAELEAADIAVIYLLGMDSYSENGDGQLCIEHFDRTMTCDAAP